MKALLTNNKADPLNEYVIKVKALPKVYVEYIQESSMVTSDLKLIELKPKIGINHIYEENLYEVLPKNGTKMRAMGRVVCCSISNLYVTVANVSVPLDSSSSIPPVADRSFH